MRGFVGATMSSISAEVACWGVVCLYGSGVSDVASEGCGSVLGCVCVVLAG